MRKTDWENAFGSVPEDFKHTVANGLHRIQKEEASVKKTKTFSIVALACIITLIAAIAYAAVTQWNLPGFMDRWFGEQMTEEGQKAMQTLAPEKYFAETDAVTVTIRQALYDGHTLHLMIATTPKQPSKVLPVLLDLLPEDPVCNLGLPGYENDFTPVQDSELAKDKILLGVEPTVSINGECPDSAGHQALEADGTLASYIQVEYAAAPGAEEIEVEYSTYMWDKQAKPEDMEIQAVSFTFPLKVTVLEQDAILWNPPREE